MAVSGHYKALRSTHPSLELKRAGKKHKCAGIMIERGERPGQFKDAWLVGHSRRCSVDIPQGEFYLANMLIADFLQPFVFLDCWPTCMYCGITFYGEFIEGEKKREYLRPVTPEMRSSIIAGAKRILAETTVIADGNPN